MLFERRCRSAGHPRSGFRPEVLDDDLLKVAVALVHIAQLQERLDALGARFADADE
jgi:hypothetical protein